MTVNHDAVAALPIVGSASKTLLRNVNVARSAYVLFDADDSRNVVLTDPSTGAITTDLLFLGRDFHYDPTDTTTAHDGTSCLVSADGLRYKLAVGTDVFAYAVINNTTSVPPVSPTVGDAYLVAAGATGAWAGHSNSIAVRTNRGWEFVNFSIGRFIYVEAIDTYYHKNAGGSWVTGIGSQTLSANSAPLSAAINFGKRLIVENQTTTAPPGSPTVGTAYIIGPSATGGWAGLDGKIAICEVAGSFVVYTPTNGWEAYDKTSNNAYTFTGSSWISSAGSIVNALKVFTVSGSMTGASGAGGYTYSATTPPTTALSHIEDSASLTYTAKKSGARLRFAYNIGALTISSSFAIGLFIDSQANAIDWLVTNAANTGGMYFLFDGVTTADALSHVYKILIIQLGAAALPATVTRRVFSVEEFA